MDLKSRATDGGRWLRFIGTNDNDDGGPGGFLLQDRSDRVGTKHPRRLFLDRFGRAGVGFDPSYDGTLEVRDTDTAGVSGASFDGDGLNDIETGGTFTALDTLLDYVIEIDGDGSPDTFRWSDDNGVSWDVSTVAITGGAQSLNNGVTVTFGATTGHTSGDLWRFTARSNYGKSLLIVREGPNQIYDEGGPGEVVTPLQKWLDSDGNQVAIINPDGEVSATWLSFLGTGLLVKVGEDSPEGVLTAPVGSLWLQTNGDVGTALWIKQSGAGNTGWAGVAGGQWAKIDDDTIGTVFQVQIFDGSDDRAIQLKVKASAHANQASTKLVTVQKNNGAEVFTVAPDGAATAYTLTVDVVDNSDPTSFEVVPSAHASQSGAPLIKADAFEANYEGRVKAASMNIGSGAAPETNGYMTVPTWLGVGGATAPTGTEKFTSSDARFNGYTQFHSWVAFYGAGPVYFDNLTATRPLKLGASKNVISEKIDLSAANDVNAAGGSNDDVCQVDSDGSLKFASLSALWTAMVAAVGAATMRSNLSAVSQTEHDAHTHNIPTQGSHDHAGAVAPDGDHDHGDTDPPA